MSVSEPRYEFGMVPSGLVATHQFTVTNVSATPVKIRIAESSCTCTSAKLDKDTLEPAERATLLAALDTSAMQAAPVASIALVAEREVKEPIRQDFAVSLAAKIDPAHGVLPSAIRFDSLRRGGAAARAAFRIVLPSIDGAVPVLSAACDGEQPHIVVELSDAPRRSADDFVFVGDTTVDPNKLAEGERQFSTRIRISVARSDGPPQEFSLVASGEVANEIEAMPSVLYWGPSDHMASREVVFSALGDAAVDIGAVECAEGGIEWTVVDNGTDRPKLVVTCVSHAKHAGVHRSSVVVNASLRNGGKRRLVVPVIIL
ncbi:MAG TPA: DUF1573 domain-containing protein [Pirellulales bacterium]|nr:DUF1573 domain-containing protein [Pirellulales bacterium]